MNWLIALALVLLVVLSVSVGTVIAGERIGARQKQLSEKGWSLWLWEQELINSADMRGCPSCRLLRRRADLQCPAPED